MNEPPTHMHRTHFRVSPVPWAPVLPCAEPCPSAPSLCLFYREPHRETPQPLSTLIPKTTLGLSGPCWNMVIDRIYKHVSGWAGDRCLEGGKVTP